MQGVYKIENKINGKVYIGSSQDMYKRWKQHSEDLMANRHVNHKLQTDFCEYGIGVFGFFIVEVVRGNKAKLLKREQFWIDAIDNIDQNYNILSYSSYEYTERMKHNYNDILNFSPCAKEKQKIKINLKIYEDINGKLNNIGNSQQALSKHWYQKNEKLHNKVGNSIRNYYDNVLRCPDFYWTTFTSFQKQVGLKGIIKSYLSLLDHPKEKRNNLAFAVNIYSNAHAKRNLSIDDDDYAVKVFLKWLIGVSDIEKPINIFIPSSRMRKLIQNEISTW